MKTPQIRSAKELAAFSSFLRQLSYLTEAGFTPAEAVAVVREGADVGQLSSRVAQVAHDLEQRDSLTAVLEDHHTFFGEATVTLIAAAEQQGTLSGALALVADDYERRVQHRKGLFIVLFWPIFLMVFLVLVTSFMMIFVIPEFRVVFASFGTNLPSLTLAIVGISDLVASYSLIWIPLIIAMPFVIVYLRRQPVIGVAIDRSLLKIPGVLRFASKSMVSRGVALLAGAAANNISFQTVVAFWRSSQPNLYLASKLEAFEQDLKQGTPLAAAWRKQLLLPRGVAQMLHTGERSRNLSVVLGRMVPFYDQDATQAATVFRRSLLLVAYLLAGLLVGVTVVAMYLPIFNLGSVV